MSVIVSSKKYDRPLLLLTVLLLIIGTIMVFSASTNISMEKYGNGTHYFWKHAFRVLAGLAALFGAMFMDYRLLRRAAVPLIIGAIVLLIITKLSYVLRGIDAPARWLRLGSFSLQTSDIARFAVIVYLAAYIDRKRNQLSSFTNGFLPPIILIGIIMALVIIQPDFSTALVIGVITFIMLFLGGAKASHLAGIVLVASAILIPVLFLAEYRVYRLTSFGDFSTSLVGKNYQLQQSLIALGNGGITGVGLGESIGKNLFLPAPHTDFILSIIGEELGFLGVFVVITLFLVLFQRVITISKGCTDVFGILLGLGFSVKIILYAFINAAVASGLLPTTGLSVPFISFGGTGLVINLMTIGILLNISMAKRRARPPKSSRILFAR